MVTITSTDARKLVVIVRATTRRTALNDAALRNGMSSMVVDITPYRNLDNDAIARAIVLQAPREWIFNAQLPAVETAPISALPTGLTGTSSRDKHHDMSSRDQRHDLSIAEIRRILFPDL